MAQIWVIDCSAAAAFLLNEAEGVQIDALIEKAGEGGEVSFLVPGLFWFELINVLLVAERRGRISREQAVELRNQADNFPVTMVSEVGALERRRIHEFAFTYKLSSYDAAYLELAERRGARLKTLDPDLLRLRAVYSWIE